MPTMVNSAAQRTAGKIADRQHAPRRQRLRRQQALDPRTAKAPRRGRSHGNRRRQRDDVSQRRHHAERSRRKADQEAGERGPGRQLEHQRRQAKEAVIACHHRLAEQEAAGQAERRSEQNDDRDQLEIVQHQRRRRKAERLQGRDLLALRGHQPSEHHVEQKRRDPEEDDGNGDRHHLLLVEFVLEETVGRLITPGDGADRTVGLEQAVEFVDHLPGVGARGERHDGVVEGAFHVEGGLRRAAVDPEHGVEAVVGDRHPRLHRIDIFGRQRDGGDAKALDPPVQHHRTSVPSSHRDSPRQRPR